MPKGNEWVLYGGDEVDLTDGMRDYVAYNLARASGEYATRTVWIEVFLVVEGRPIAPSDYHGIYIGEEHIGRVSGGHKGDVGIVMLTGGTHGQCCGRGGGRPVYV